MSAINSNQGAIKLSEVAVDTAQVVANTPANEDALTVYQSLQSVISDLLSRMSLFLTSQAGYPSTTGPGIVIWSGNTISLSSTSIVVKLVQAPSGTAIDLVMNYSATNTATGFNTLPLANNEILYIELDRSNLTGPVLILENGFDSGVLSVLL